MLTAKSLSAGANHMKRLDGNAIAIYSSQGDPLVLVIEQAPSMHAIYSAAKDGDQFIQMMRKYDPALQLSIDTLRV